MKSPIEPTVGRVVLLWPNGESLKVIKRDVDGNIPIVGYEQQDTESQSFAATIACVVNECTGHIALSFVDHNGDHGSMKYVEYAELDNESTHPAPGNAYWTWMPYQLKKNLEEQKTEALAAKTD